MILGLAVILGYNTKSTGEKKKLEFIKKCWYIRGHVENTTCEMGETYKSYLIRVINSEYVKNYNSTARKTV